jgi:hypothetical protein
MRGVRVAILLCGFLILSSGIQSQDRSARIAANRNSALAIEPDWEETIVASVGERVGNRGVEVCDVDNDDQNEILVGFASFDEPQLRYYKLEEGDWVEHIISNDTVAVQTVCVGDLDEDNEDEILVVGCEWNYTGAEVRYFEFVDGEWVSHDIVDIGIMHRVPYVAAIGDLDNDGVNEVAIGLGGNEGYELLYYEYDGGAWTEYPVDDDLGETDGIEIADIDHDEMNELVHLGLSAAVNATRTYHALHYYKQDGEGWNRTTIRCGTGWDIDAGDVDNDGQIEIAWGNCEEEDNEVRVYDYIDGTWTETNVSDMNGGAVGVGIYSVVIGDADNDAKNELLIGGGSPFLQVRYYEYEDDTWQETNITSVYPSVVQAEAIGDVDNDGENEIVVGLWSYSGELFDEIRYYEQADETATSTTSTTTTTTTITTTRGEISPLLLVIGIGVPVVLAALTIIWKIKK